ncbi:OsmC family protein [Parapedobacter sp. GCM10030251]|jgi:peroxiredoxin, OsmC subfamily|uniref:OsmC family protein n=1 Tax=Parapedobacter sp. GCM10030251 TaxID=3273419 RepID=UPI00360D8C10
MKFTRKASANWQGTGKDGKGSVTTQSTVLDQTPYSYKTRFEDGVGTNPEELIGAAHAGCFTMQLSFLLSEKGYEPTSLDTEAKVTFEDGSITAVQLDLTGNVPGISESDFKEIAEKAKEICPISKLLNTAIGLNAVLS